MMVLKAATKRPDVMSFRPSMGLKSKLVRTLRRELVNRSLSAYKRTRPPGQERFSSDRCEYRFPELLAQMPEHDILHLHWTTGLVDLPGVGVSTNPDARIVWTLHDMNLFTGGCHFAGSCNRFESSCGQCPQLGSRDPRDLSNRVWNRKRQTLSRVGPVMHAVAPCEWMASHARKSSLLRDWPVSTIRYGLDLNDFAPRPQEAARQAIGIPAGARVVLFVSNYLGTTRKGLHLLDEAFARLNRPDLFLLAIGHGTLNLKSPVPHLQLNHTSDDRLLSAVYSAADILAVPSLEDNSPNTVTEAMACGTPSIAFAVGGICELIESGHNGVLVAPGDVTALASAVASVFSQEACLTQLRQQCRQTALDRNPIEKQAKEYIALYESLLSRKAG